MRRLPPSTERGEGCPPSARSIADGGSATSPLHAPAHASAEGTQRRAAIWAALRAWYPTARRDLPWRRTRDPYAIVVSEVMLQQTQVERVVPKYAEFLARFPTWQSLAAAPRSDVVRAWAGLGYNRRAVSLHRLAQLIVDEHRGCLPASVAALARLPGLGPYTAAAVACFALGQRVPVVDTNVRRVLGRLFVGPAGASERAIRALAAWALPPEGAADWHQALMDLAAAICRARRPACGLCPVAAWCLARAGLYDAAARPGGPWQQRQVAEQRSPYGRGYVGSRRYYRGRVIAVLRDLPPGATLALADLGPRVKPGYHSADAAWLRELASGLVADGLVQCTESGGDTVVKLADGGTGA